MKNLFNTVQLRKPKNNFFDLTHDVKMSGKMGNLMPCLTLECVPGDRFNLGCDTLLRFAPLLAPVMHRMDATVHYFFVPNRLVWDSWEKFIVGDPSAPVHPTFEIDNTLSADERIFLDYMGIPPNPGATIVKANALPIAAYQKIYNDYYRDQNLIPAVFDKVADGVNAVADFCVMRKRAFEHDYFTAALPFAQKGQAVDIPLGDVTLNPDWATNEDVPHFENPTGAFITGDIHQNNPIGLGVEIAPGVYDAPQAYDPDGSLQVQATTINDLRRAFKLQEWLEKNARAGTRYVESILAHFGVRSSDKRLQRAEYITGVKSPVVISEVLNTTGTDDAPQGDMSGHAVSITSGKSGSYYCEEHGFIIGILSVMPKTAYQQGVAKMYLKDSYLDYFFPSFAHLGEQEVTNDEIYAYQANGKATFGYIPRYAEYKYMPSRVAGDFRTTLNFWHLGRIFATQPTLNREFIECEDTDFNRIFAVNDAQDNLWMHILHRVTAVRPMPKYGTPML